MSDSGVSVKLKGVYDLAEVKEDNTAREFNTDFAHYMKGIVTKGGGAPSLGVNNSNN